MGWLERVDLDFLRWVWRYPTDSRSRLVAALARHPHLDVVDLTSPSEVRCFMARSCPTEL